MSGELEADDPGCAWVEPAAMMAALHPFFFAKTLMQLGYEPRPPAPSRTFFGRPVLRLPNILVYMNHLRRVDGFLGLYRAFGANVAGRIVYFTCLEFVRSELPPVSLEQSAENPAFPTDSEKFLTYIKRTSQESLMYAVAIVAAQPFQVVTIRMMAQFIGRETKYNTLIGSLIDIYKEEGLSALWSGVLPTLYGSLLQLWIPATVYFALGTYIIKEDSPTYITAASGFIASNFTYPFVLVSTVSAVSGAPIAAGGPPHTAHYSSWIQCYAHLKKHGQLNRGSSIFYRYYQPVAIVHGYAVKKEVDLGTLD